MFNLAAFSADAFWGFLQVFARVSALFASAPVFGSREIPATVKAGLAGIVSLALLPLVKPTLGPTVPETVYGMAANLAGQTVIGLLMGLIASLVFVAVRIGGDVIDYQMGFTQATTFNPQFNETVSPFANLQYRFALLLYLGLNGHHMLIKALGTSFLVLPVAKIALGGHALDVFKDITFQMLIAGLQVAAPGGAVLLITDIAFAFLSRAVPQMQVYFVGMPVKVIFGFIVVIAVLPLLAIVIVSLTHGSPDDLTALLHGMHR